MNDNLKFFFRKNENIKKISKYPLIPLNNCFIKKYYYDIPIFSYIKLNKNNFF